MSETKKQTAQPAPKRKRRRYSEHYPAKFVLPLLILCFPAGLMFLWSRRCRIPKLVKYALSALVAAALVFILLPQTTPPERVVGGVVPVTAEESQTGPLPASDFERIDLYSYNVTAESVIAEPEPTPVPIYVYCNDGGKYYHSKECSYVKPKSSRVTLLQALNAGYQQCKDCNAPEAY